MAWLTAEQALAVLGTKPQSLYASVSRGRIRARSDPDDPRKSLYDRADIERLATRGGGRRKATAISADAIRWGDPVLPSSISTVTGGHLYYRGKDAVGLAETAGLEEVAALLWEAREVGFHFMRPPPDDGEGNATEALGGFLEGSAVSLDLAAASSAGQATRANTPLAMAFAVMAARAASDPPSLSQPPAARVDTAARLVATFATALGATPGEAPVHRRLANAWRRPETAGLLRRALVLLADHELNASTFAARIAASTGAPLAATVLAGLATLVGPLHGSASTEVARLAALTQREGTTSLIRTLPAGGRTLPGFGHRLYPAGDPRAEALLEQMPLPPAFATFAELGRDLTGEAPNVDFALAALAAAYDLPPAAPLQLFALARSVGWLAHAMEQLATGTLIRPRASYIGVVPALP
jgi:citrate synthase